MNSPKVIWKYLKPNEMMLVMFGVFFFLAVVSLITMYRAGANDKFNGQLRYEMLPAEKRREIESVADAARAGETDPNLRYTERIREASAIALGLSLFLIRERVSNNRVMTLQEAMTEFAKSELLPPLTEVLLTPERKTDFGLLQTARGIYYVRYSAAPLKIEILSGGWNGMADGSTFILRIPDTAGANLPINADTPKVSSAGAWATLYEAPKNENHYIPPPFAPVQSFTAMNWQVRPVQQTELSPERIKELNAYLQKQQ